MAMEGIDEKQPLTITVLQSQKYHLENPYWKTFDP